MAKCPANGFVVLELSCSFTDMQLHSVGLRPSSQLTNGRSAQLKALLAALEAGKRFLDVLLTYPADEYHLISFAEWMRLPWVIMTIARLCMPSEAHTITGWDVRAAQERVRLELCLESFCYRLQSLSTFDKAHVSRLDFWYAMKAIIDLTRSWYLRKIRPEPSSNPQSQSSPENTVGQSTSDRSHQSPMTWPTPFTNQAGEPYTTLAGINHINNVALDVDIPMNDDYAGMFDFLKDPDYDMEQFFMGIWSDEVYLNQGFGGGGGAGGGTCAFQSEGG